MLLESGLLESVLSKTIGTWLMPLPLALLLLAVGCLCLWGQWQRSGRWFVTAASLLLAVVSCSAISDLLLLPLEEQYPKWNGQGDNLAFVVVMGAGQEDAPRLPVTNRPNNAAIYRLLEGIAIYRANPGSKLILSGGGERESSAKLMAQVAQAIGIAPQDIVLQTISRNTEQEVQLLAPMVGRQRFAVVTSAAHMPRTISLFTAAGLQPTPAPTHFLDRFNPHPNWHDWTIPTADSLLRAQFALHEYLGIFWLKIKTLWN